MAGLGTIKISASRLGTVDEVSEMLHDFETAYCALYQFELELGPFRLREPWPLDPFYRRFIGCEGKALTPEMILPKYRLRIQSVRIESPGFWEFLGSLNPLQQLRLYLNDRHDRRKDKLYRESSEQVRMQLEEEWLRTNVARERLGLLREMGHSDDEIRQNIWNQLGIPLSNLGKHQDKGLIDGSGETVEHDTK